MLKQKLRGGPVRRTCNDRANFTEGSRRPEKIEFLCLAQFWVGKMRQLLKAFFALSAFAISQPAAAVEISVVPAAIPLVTVSGQLKWGDEAKFRDKTASLTNAIVLFDSPGGNLVAGIEIGTTIRMKGFTTAVLDGRTCASACAFAWLGGAKRVMQPRSLVGFHAVSVLVDGEQKESSDGNALAGAYLNRIGMTDRAVMYITSTPSASITWMSPLDAVRNGIGVALIPSSARKDVAAQSPPQAKPSIQDDPASDAKLAERLAADFSQRYKTSGMVGVRAGIDACYRTTRAAPVKTEALLYCVALDEIGAMVDQAVMQQLHRPQSELNTLQAVYERAHELSAASGWNEASLVKRSFAVASTALKLVAFEPAATVATAQAAPAAGVIAVDDAKVQLSERCSMLADERQLHGAERRAFRTACKAGR